MKKSARFVKTIWGVIVMTIGAACPRTMNAADATVGLDLVSAYVFRGSTFNDGPVLQPGLTINNFKLNEKTPLPLTLGVWANMDLDDYGDTLDEGEFSEVDFNASYALPKLTDKLGWSIGYCEYMYPGAADNDREVNLGFTYDTFLSPSLTLNYGLDGTLQDNWHIEGGLSQAFDLNPVKLTLSGSLAYQILAAIDTPQFTIDRSTVTTVQDATTQIRAQYQTWATERIGTTQGFGPLVITVTATYRIMTASASYVVRLDDNVIANYDVKVVGKLGISYTF